MEEASADIHQQNVGVLGTGVKGTLLDNGNFIFKWETSGGYFKMVLTKNDGSRITSGYLSPASRSTWKDYSTWTDNRGGYWITNFNALKTGKILTFILILIQN